MDSNEAILKAGNAHPLNAAGQPVPRDKHYPAVRYHATEEPRRVLNADEDDDLGDGWHDSPKKAAGAGTPKAAKAAKPAKAGKSHKKAAKADTPDSTASDSVE